MKINIKLLCAFLAVPFFYGCDNTKMAGEKPVKETARIYYRFGLNERQVRILALSQPKRQYYYQSSLGNRLFELGLGPLALAYCAVSSKEEQKQIQQILGVCGKEGFNAAWLRHKELAWAAELL